MDQEQEDRRPTDSDVPTKKQRLNRPRLTPLQNPYNIMNWLPANQVNQRMVNFEQQANGIDEQQQAGRRRKRRTKRKTSKKSRKSRRKYRR
jgi:hypothetical protein